MTWGGLNNALTAWRNAYNARLPGRGTASDGARADAAHGSTSQHQEDSDGTVDANDMDVNVLGSSTPTGTADERRIIEAMKLDFEQDPYGRSRLWIHQREIASRAVGAFRERDYDGASPHTEHVHWESEQGREDDGRTWPMPHTDAVLAELRGDDEMDIQEFFASVGRATRTGLQATNADRENRNNFAAALRFAAGLNPEDQTSENLPLGEAGLLQAIVDKLPEGPPATELH